MEREDERDDESLSSSMLEGGVSQMFSLRHDSILCASSDAVLCLMGTERTRQSSRRRPTSAEATSTLARALTEWTVLPASGSVGIEESERLSVGEDSSLFAPSQIVLCLLETGEIEITC